ncbi:hypothetical protein [Streptomyces sp. NPDC059909]|uniref:hypothetical protein n=1 Tax=Streptomyces sp. NPDC059909 TaxID=3346998 RepID=UPI003656416C
MSRSWTLSRVGRAFRQQVALIDQRRSYPVAHECRPALITAMTADAAANLADYQILANQIILGIKMLME